MINLNNFETILPIRLFYSKEGDSLFNEFNDYKLLFILDYLHINTNRLGISFFSIEDIITTYGFKPDSHKGKINEQIHNCIRFLISKDIIEVDSNIDKIKPKELIRCKYNYDTSSFRKIDYNAVRAIVSIEDKKIDRAKLLFYYSYLCARMYKRKEGAELRSNGGVAESCYPSYETITKDIGLSDTVIKKYNDILVDMNLIRIGNAGLYYYANDKNKIVRESPNFYVLFKLYWEDELKESIKVWKETHTNMIFKDNRLYKNNNRKINGFIARINALEEQGKATEEQLKQRDSYLESKEIVEDTITDIRNKIKKINENLLQLDDVCNFDTVLYENIEDYFDDKNKDYYNIEDCKYMLDYINNFAQELYKEVNNIYC